MERYEKKYNLNESFFEDYERKIMELVKATEEFNSVKTKVQDVLLDIRKIARKEKRQDVLNAIDKIESSMGTSFSFENALWNFEDMIKE